MRVEACDFRTWLSGYALYGPRARLELNRTIWAIAHQSLSNPVAKRVAPSRSQTRNISAGRTLPTKERFPVVLEGGKRHANREWPFLDLGKPVFAP
jgi:hypothetical protein